MNGSMLIRQNNNNNNNNNNTRQGKGRGLLLWLLARTGGWRPLKCKKADKLITCKRDDMGCNVHVNKVTTCTGITCKQNKTHRYYM